MERLTLLLTQSKMFDWFRPRRNLNNKLRTAVYGVVMEFLLLGLTSSQKKILLHKHWHQSDPNDSGTGRMVSFLQRLINDACFLGMNHNCIKTDLYIHSLKNMVGLEEGEDLFKKEIEAINTTWGDYASISFEDKHLHFEIHLKK